MEGTELVCRVFRFLRRLRRHEGDDEFELLEDRVGEIQPETKLSLPELEHLCDMGNSRFEPIGGEESGPNTLREHKRVELRFCLNNSSLEHRLMCEEIIECCCIKLCCLDNGDFSLCCSWILDILGYGRNPLNCGLHRFCKSTILRDAIIANRRTMLPDVAITKGAKIVSLFETNQSQRRIPSPRPCCKPP